MLSSRNIQYRLGHWGIDEVPLGTYGTSLEVRRGTYGILNAETIL